MFQPTTVEVKGLTYRVNRLDVIQQFHVARKLAPVLAAMGVSLVKLKDGEKVDIDDFLPILGVIMQIMAAMPKEDVDYILSVSLACVQRDQGAGKWAAVSQTTPQGMRLMFEDIELAEMLRLVLEVLRLNLSNFLTGLGAETASPGS